MVKMKDIIHILIVTLIVFCLCRCSKEEIEGDVLSIKLDYSHNTDNSELLTDDYFNNRQIIKLETTDESFISQISRLIIFDDKYFIFDHRTFSIHIFDKTGKFLYKIKRIGRGPGEYIQLTDFTIDAINKNIVLLCDIPNCIIYLDIEGNFIKQEKKKQYDHYLSSDNNALYFASFLMDEKDSYINVKNGNSHSEFLPIDEYLINKDFYGPHPNIVKSDNIYFFKAYDNCVYELRENNVFQKYIIDFGNKSIDKSFVEENVLEDILIHSSENDLICRINDFRESDDYIVFTTWPYTKIVIYNKLNKTLKLTSKFYDPEIGLNLYNFIGHDGSGRNMIFVVSSTTFINDLINNKNKKIEKSKLFLEMREIAANMDENENPILFSYGLK